MAGRVTIYEVAARAGVSISTVSLAMNAPSRVSKATRSKIYEIAEEIGFEPKSEAIARARRGVGRIGVLAPFSSYPSFYERLSGILEAVEGQGLEIVVFDHESAATAVSPLLSSLPFTARMDGLIVMGMPLDDSVARRLATAEIPTVLVDMTHPGFDAVYTDDVEGGRLVAAHLCDLGYEQFAFLGERQRSQGYKSPSERRLEGFTAALADRGLELPEPHVAIVPLSWEAARDAARKLLNTQTAPIGVFAHDDMLAAGAFKAAESMQLDVPHQVGIVGFDDTHLAALLELTSVRQPLRESGTTAVRLLLDRLGDLHRTTRNIALELRLITRSTTARP